MTNLIDELNSRLPAMSQTDQKIAQVILTNPRGIINDTISELAKKAGVSDASVSRFCRNLGLKGFHELKIQLAQLGGLKESESLTSIPKDDLQAALAKIQANKLAEIETTLSKVDTETLQAVLHLLETSRLIQVSAEGDTYPVAADAVYKFNQIGILAFASGGNVETAIAQSMNLTDQDCLLVISNSGESAALLQEVAVAKQKGMKIIAVTNRPDSPIGMASDYHLRTGVRQGILQTQYYFSRVTAFTMIEALFLLLIKRDESKINNIKYHERLISGQKI